MNKNFMKAPGGDLAKAGTRRRIMRNFQMDEISAVDFPAQEHALMTIMKRADKTTDKPGDDSNPRRRRRRRGESSDKNDDSMEKVLLLTSVEDGHQHMVRINLDAMERGGGHTDFSSGETSGGAGQSPGHDHPFVINADGTITIGASNAHTHSVELGELMARLSIRAALATDEGIIEPMFARKNGEIVDDEEFAASDFALVPDATDPSTWKYRLVRKSGSNPDRRLVGNAVAALQRGKIVKDERAAVIRRVREAWTKSHVGQPRSEMPTVLKRASSRT